MSFRADLPYNQLPQLPPDIDLIETRTVLKACISARAALAELKQAGELLPNQSMLINLLPLLEAKDSSEIENIVTTTDQLFQYAQEDTGADHATKEALRYRTALNQGFTQLTSRPLCSNTAVEVCSTLKNMDMDIRKVPGTVIGNQTTGEIVYTPPVGEDVIRGLLANWENFLHDENDIDPLIKMAVSHYQFEAIHPFYDGNGRTGRILNVLFLIEQKLLSLPILYLSRYIVQNKQDYYRLLNQVTREQNWQDWLLFILQGVEQTCIWTCNKIAAIKALIDVTSDYIRDQLPKIYSYELVQLIFEQPYCRINNLVEKDIAKRQTASTYLKKLTDIGVLKEVSVGKEKLFVHPKLMQLMIQDSNDVSSYDAE
ncbi:MULTISPECIES: protein adenylyltransferase Fic [Marinomonas]|uniref:Protein adenylyltransferase n=1 Tax=Marinomonas arctica TaxID=383750 RepID=A0A7H1J669_9GAMM|nr:MULTISPECIES: Fic family protein [Marinomonas]MCS7484972.1 addiction module protein [Marinomonas sp. BSi20414]QNT05985.1 Fic family protein [Marinomonas arctica]GGN19741.1 adenosine monophosphate-protein transferase SoFic [Marinomonas arctica]